MINLLLALQKDRFIPRYYIAAATDNMSLQKARTFESSSCNEVNMFPCWLLAAVASFVLYCLIEQNELNQIINDFGYMGWKKRVRMKERH